MGVSANMLYIIRPGDIVRCHTESLYRKSYIAKVSGVSEYWGTVSVKTFNNERLHLAHTDVKELIKIGPDIRMLYSNEREYIHPIKLKYVKRI